MLRLLFFAATALTAGTLSAQEAKSYVPVYLRSQCTNDTVGQRMSFKVREGLRRSSSMKVADSYQDSVIQISLVCLDPESNENGSVSRYSYAITFFNHKGFYDYILTHGVGTCGTRRVDECAEGLVADIDSEVGKLNQRIGNGSFKPFDP